MPATVGPANWRNSPQLEVTEFDAETAESVVAPNDSVERMKVSAPPEERMSMKSEPAAPPSQRRNSIFGKLSFRGPTWFQSSPARRNSTSETAYDETLASLRRRIAERESTLRRQTRFVLHPRRVKWIGMWDLVSTLALLYTAAFCPVEAVFVTSVYGPDALSDGFYIINRLLDAIFFFDMILQFFVAYQKIDSRGNQIWVERHDRIVRHYLSTWFLLDAFTIFVPLGFDIYSATPQMLELAGGKGNGGGCVGGASGSGADASTFGILRVLRVLRLMKLVRLVRASRIYERWKTRITVSSGMMTMLQCTFMVLVAAHWCACLMALQASLQPNPLDTWLGPSLYGFCEDPEFVSSDPMLAPLATSCEGPLPGCIHRDGPIQAFAWYLASLSWSMMILTGSGGTDFYPNPASESETFLVMILVVSGALLWTRVLALFCNVATNSNPGVTHFNQQLDGINDFIQSNDLPKELGRRVREYLHQVKGAHLQSYQAKALSSLSPSLQIELVIQCHRKWMDGVWFFNGFDDIVLVRLAMRMNWRVLAPGEVAPLGSLYAVSRGCVLFGMRVLSRGMSWGDDVILTNPLLASRNTARAMNFVDVQVLTRNTLNQVVSNFPKAAQQLRRSTILLALKRFVTHAAKQSKARRRSQRNSIKELGNGSNSMDAPSVTEMMPGGLDAPEERVSNQGMESLPADGGAGGSAASPEMANLLRSLQEQMQRMEQDARAANARTQQAVAELREDVVNIRQDVARGSRVMTAL